MCGKDESVKGSLQYVDHITGMRVHSNTITQLVIVGTQATIYGTATINGRGSFDFVVVVYDNGEPGAGVDSFELRLGNGYTAGGTIMAGGNIRIHKER